MALNFQYIFMKVCLEVKEMELVGIQVKLCKVIISNTMRKLLRKGHHGVIAQF
jgi:hypothetical protein